MLGDAGDHPRSHTAADAELAGIIDVDAGFVQHLQDFLPSGMSNSLPERASSTVKPPDFAASGFGREIFHMDLPLRPARGRRSRMP